MKIARKIVLCAVLIAILCVGTAGLTYAEIAVESTPEVITYKSIAYVAFAWFIYTMVGLLAAIIGGNQSFDVIKFTRTFLWALIVMVVAILMKSTPTAVIENQDNLITSTIAVVMNSGAGMSLIYVFDKIWTIISGINARFKARLTPKPA